jgi:CHAT domain-containing protein
MRSRHRSRLTATLAATAFCLLAGACYVGLTRASHSRTHRAQAVMEKIRHLRSEGRYADALASAIDLSRTLESDARAPAWERSDAARLRATLNAVTNLPDSLRRALAEADQADGTIRELINQGQYRTAAARATNQLAVRRRVLGEEAPDVAVSLSTVADVVMVQGDIPEARDLYNRALSMRRRILGEKHPDVAQSLDALGLAEKDLGNLDRARSCYLQSYDLRRELFGALHPSIAASLNRQAELLRREFRPDDAFALFRQALHMLEKSSEAESPTAAEVLCNLGLAGYYRGDYASAERYLRRALKIGHRNHGVSLETTVLGLSVYGATLWKEHRYAEAEPLQEECARIYEFLRGQGKPGALFYGDVSIYAQIALTQLELGDSAAAWNSLERSLNRLLLDALDPPADRSTAGSDPDGPDDGRFCSLERVQSHLTDSTAMVGWLTTYTKRNGIWAYPAWTYVIRRHGPVHWFRIGAPSSSGNESGITALNALVTMLREQSEWPVRMPADPELIEKAKEVYRELLLPLEPNLSGVTHLVIISALLGGGIAELLIDPSGVYVGQKYEISYAPSATLFVWLREHAPPRRDPRGWRVLAVGDPGPRSTSASGGARSSLPGSRREVVHISTIFPTCEVLLGREASRQNIAAMLRSRKLAKYDLIHLALHTTADSDPSAMSSLLFDEHGGTIEPINDMPMDSEKVSSREIGSAWKLSADLVTVSACRSRPGSNGTEERNALSEAFLRTGAHSVLASVRDVDDEATSLLMQRYYEDLVGAYRDERHGHVGQSMSKVEALYEASNWLREYRDPHGREPFANPVYWSAFTLVGDAGE